MFGTAMAVQTFATCVLENRRHLAALQAMGASNGLLSAMLLFQAMTVGIIGYGMGLGLTALFGFAVAENGQAPFKLQPEAILRTFAAILLISGLAALLGIRKVAKPEPAVVFRG